MHLNRFAKVECECVGDNPHLQVEQHVAVNWELHNSSKLKVSALVNSAITCLHSHAQTLGQRQLSDGSCVRLWDVNGSHCCSCTFLLLNVEELLGE